MTSMHPVAALALIAMGTVALVSVSYFASAPHLLSSDAQPVAAAPAAVAPAAVAEVAAATPNHDPLHAKRMPLQTAETVAVAVSDRDPRHLRTMPAFPLNPATLSWELEAAAAPSTPAPEPAPAQVNFAALETTLYAKDKARLRAAPNTDSDVLTKLAADTPLHAIGRSTDGAWWQISLDGGRTGYLYKTGATKQRMVATKAPAPSRPVAVAAQPQPASNGGSQDLLAYVDNTMTWLAQAAGGGSPRPGIRTEH